MAYDALEVSNYAGGAIRLYELTRQGVTWRYTTCETDVVYGGQTYFSRPVGDEGVKQKGEAVTDDFTIILPSSEPIPSLFNGTPPLDPIKAVMRAMQPGDTEAPIMWVGYVSSVKFRDEVTSAITCNTQTATFQRKGVRLSWTRACPHALYDEQCRADKTLFRKLATITALTGNSFTFTYLDGSAIVNDGAFTNGFIEWNSNPTTIERRGITSQLNDTILTLGQTDGLVVGLIVYLYRGCNRLPETCLNVFNNIDNFGGFPFLPGKSPFDGDPVF